MLSEAAAQIVVLALMGYLLIGLPIAAAFVTRGAARVDPAAADTTWGFRLAILPGCIALWPWVIARWRRGAAMPTEQNAHRMAARPADADA